MGIPTPTDWMNDPEQIKLFEQRMRAGGMSRRRFLSLLGALGGAAALAACGASSTPVSQQASSAPSTAASSAPSTAPSTAASAAPSTAASAAPSTGASAAPTAGAAGVATSTRATGPATTTGGTPAAGGTGSPALSTWPANLPKPTDAAADAQQTFVYFLPEDPSSFDFNKDLYAGGQTFLFESLLRFDPDFNLAAATATSYETKDNGATYTFKLNPAATWSNGDPLTADDYIWSWTRQLDPATAASYAGFLLDIKGAEAFNSGKGGTAAGLGLKAIDKQTLQVTLEGPRGYFPILTAYTAADPAHKASVDKFGDKWTEPGSTGAPVVSNGPFVLTAWNRGQQADFVRNEKYATGPKPLLAKISSPIIPNTAGLAPYENGQLDYRSFRGIPVGEIPRLLADPKLKTELVRHSQSGLWYLVPEVDHEPFTGENGKKVRLAMQKAINRDQLVKVIQNLGEPAYSLLAPDIPYFIDPAKYPEFKNAVNFDPNAAKQMLVGTPYEGGKFPNKIVMSLRDEGATTKTAAEFIQSQLKQNLGMDIELDIKPTNVFNDPMFKRQYQLIFIRWYMDYPDPNNFYKEVFYSRKSSGKRQAWSNDAYDDLVLKAAAEADQTKRGDLYRQAEKLLQSDGAYVPLYYGYAYALFKSKMGGIPMTKAGVPQPDWNIFLDMVRSLYVKK
jgi:ABC-type oligopeptide transport system substrate-binding subunit